MRLFGKKEKDEILSVDPLVNLMMVWTDKMINGKVPYDERVVNLTVEIVEMDCKTCIQKAEFVLNFFMVNKEIKGVNKEVLVKKLEEDLLLMKEKYKKIVEMKNTIKKETE